jgi:flavin reductase (DIM6/NTAB) family NADH-FMN oxidoreductase RutF
VAAAAAAAHCDNNDSHHLRDGVAGGFFASTVFPRCLAWISTNETRVALLQGYNAVGYTPPCLMMSSDVLPEETLDELRRAGRCTLSAVTAHESPADSALRKAAAPASPRSGRPASLPFEALGLEAFRAEGFESYPPAVALSPMRFYCTLDREVPLPPPRPQPPTTANDASALAPGEEPKKATDDAAAMILLTMETVVVDGSVLRPPTQLMKGRDVTAKIDCDLIRPWLGLSDHQFSLLASPLRSMPRPKRNPDGATWTSTDLELNPDEEYDAEGSSFGAMEWSFRRDGRSCALGYNPVTAIIMPRPIGWISSYHYPADGDDRCAGRVSHLAPYSFFTDVSRSDSNPVVAFSGFRTGGVDPKDAQNDAQSTGCFVYNLVSESLAVAMNYSAAELGRAESEFDLAGLDAEPAKLVDAPMVRDALVRYECEYVRTEDVGSFSIVIGRVVGVHALVTSDGVVDPIRARPVTRLGYTNEYGTLP